MPTRLEFRNVCKSFGAARVLDQVSFSVEAGEVHVLAGENGAGKSTLMRTLSGAISDYGGSVLLDGVERRFASPRAAARAGVAIIHQELSLVATLSIADNFLLPRGGSAFSLLSRRAGHDIARRALATLELHLDPGLMVEALPLSQRQLVEVARAFAESARVLIMDEPTSALSEPEAERLFARIEKVRAAGAAVIYISHRMEEIYRIADRISVLRDGRHVVTAPAAELDREQLMAAMLGRHLKRVADRRRVVESARRLVVRCLGVASRPALRGVSFTLHAGEVLGLAGLAGSGAQSLLAALFGAAPIDGGELELDSLAYAPRSPAAALARGVALLQGDRGQSVLPNLSVLENASLSSLAKFSRLGVIAQHKERDEVGELARSLALRAPALSVLAAQLSGGNQQKVALLRCLMTRPKLLLLDEPTRGIDVGAKAEVYQLIGALAASGVSVILHSSELDELCTLCDRVLALTRGQVTRELSRAELERERLLAAIMGSAA